MGGPLLVGCSDAEEGTAGPCDCHPVGLCRRSPLGQTRVPGEGDQGPQGHRAPVCFHVKHSSSSLYCSYIIFLSESHFEKKECVAEKVCDDCLKSFPGLRSFIQSFIPQIQRGAKVGVQLWVRETRWILVLFISYCAIFHTHKGTPCTECLLCVRPGHRWTPLFVQGWHH